MNRLIALCICAAGLGAADLAIAPERVVIDARQPSPAPVEVVLSTPGQAPLEVKAEIVDPLAAHAQPGVDIGKPVFPFTIALSGPRVAPGAPAKLAIAYAPDAGSHAQRAWQVATDVVRIRSSEVGLAVYDIPVAIRFHTRPVVVPALPVGQAQGQGWALSFTLRSADPEERIAAVALDGLRALGGPGAKPIVGTLVRAEDGTCRIAIAAAPAGPITADLAITYDQPAAARKLLNLRCRLGEAKAAAPQRPADPAGDAPPAPASPRRVRIN